MLRDPDGPPPVCVGARVTRAQRQRARQLRRQATEAEKRVWEVLRNRKCLGLKFRRQQVIDGYIVDFYCPQLRLALEVDGPIHDDPMVAARDAIRDGHLADWVVDVVRIRNEEATPERLRELLAPYAKRLRGPPRR